MKLTAVLPLVALSLALTAVVKTNDQQAQQTFINAAIGALAIRAGSSPNRRSDLQLHYDAVATRESIVRKRVLSNDCTARVSARIAA
jgi:hypothetical protein